MAGNNPQRIAERTWNIPEAVVLLCGFLAIFLVEPASAAVAIVTQRGTITTDCYRIHGSQLFLCDGTAFELRDIISIDTANITEHEQQKQQEAIAEFYEKVHLLLGMEGDFSILEKRCQEVLEYIVSLKAGAKNARRLGDAAADAQTMLQRLEHEAKQMRGKWKDLEIPERTLVMLRDIKILEYHARILAYQEWLKFLKTSNPTLREYAKEHTRQARNFGMSFQQHLQDHQTTP